MSSSPEDFDQIKRLLACKRYEQPPSGYFNYFSHRVIARIEMDEQSRGSTWWAWLMERFEAKPILACAYGVVVSSLLFVGFKLSEIFEREVVAAPMVGGLGLASSEAQASFSGAFGSAGLFERSAVVYSTSLSPSFRQERAADFYRDSNLRVQAVGFSSRY